MQSLKFFHHKKIHGFTIMEVMIVTILIAIIAGFALPNFSRAVARGRVRDAITQLSALYAANMIYKAQNNNQYFVGTNLDLNAINAGLGINLIANGFTYSYTGTANTFTASAQWTTGSAFTVSINQNPINMTVAPPNRNPWCSTGTCVGL